MKGSSSPCAVFARGVILVASAFVAMPVGADAQGLVRVRAEENFRAEPNGELLARLEAGTPLGVVSRRGNWVEVDLEGWVWMRSLQVVPRSELNLVVSEAEGENLRGEPSGTILGRLSRGMLLQELERITGWIRVRRRGWIWGESVVETAATQPAAPATGRERADPGPAARSPGGFVSVGGRAAAILTSPDGDTLARAAPGTELEVTGREGSWVRVRLEGWTWMPPAGSGAVDSVVTTPLTPDDLSREPIGFRGRIVSWRLQFISLERAEKIRTDFFEGEPFLLTRFGTADGPFVYVAVPPERLGEVEGLLPLERLSVTARVRTGASTLTSTPIVDLIAFERVR